MATNTFSMAPNNTTDAGFRLWGSAMKGVFEVGSQAFWIQTTDTGQINWTTVTSPAANTLTGYEIYKTNDALSATFTLYMRVDFGSGGNGTKGPYMRFAFGTGTNGAGTLTGNVTANYDHRGNTAGTSTNGTTFASAAAGRFGMFVFDTTVAAIFTVPLMVERSVDTAGAYTADYVTFTIGTVADAATALGFRTVFRPAVGTLGTALTDCYTFWFSGASAAFGSFSAPFLVFPFRGYPDNCMTQIVGLKSGDISEGQTFDLTLYGVSKHYLWSNRGPAFLGSTAGLSNIGVGMRYE